ncbi:MAG: GGDEF domain-containing protein [Elusimicrobiota bacterium]
MLNRRNVTFIVCCLIFAAVSAALYRLQGWEAVLFPAYGLIYLWNDLRNEEETHIIFLFLTFIAGFLVSTRLADVVVVAALVAEGVGIVLLCAGLSIHRGRLGGESHRIRSEVEKLDLHIRDHQREHKFYQAYESSALTQIRLRRDLTQAARSLGNTMDSQEVKLRLTGILEGRFKGSKVSILPGRADDPVAQYVLKSRTPVLVKDMRKEVRFGPRTPAAELRSSLVVQLNVMKKPYGFVRVETGQPDAYSNDDLKTVDLFATLAGLTLENIQLYDKVGTMAAHDSLTRLVTQRTFLQRLKEELLRAGRAQMPLSLIMLDVDHFKRYNDTYGHQAGDEVLRTVSRILVNRIRQVDCAARYGGEEFMVILPNVDPPRAREVAEDLRAAIEAEPLIFQGQRTRVTASFGVSSFPQDATSQSQLVRSVDERLYQSKAQGRNRVTG